RTSPAHYVVFVRPVRRGSPGLDRSICILDSEQRGSWRAVVAVPATSAASDAWKPFRSLPDELIGATVLQAAHPDRHSTLRGRGPGWTTHVVAALEPDQVVVTYGADPARSMVWTWRTSRDVASTGLRIVSAANCGSRVPIAGDDEPGNGLVRVTTGDS